MNFKQRLQELSIQKKLVLGLTVFFIIFFGVFATIEIHQIGKMLDRRSVEDLTSRVDGVISTLKNIFEVNISFQKHAVNVAESFIAGKVKLDYRRPLDIMVIDQISKKEHRVRIPAMRVAGIQVYQTDELIDKISKQTNTTVTLFQSIPQGLLRIATNVEKLDGTFIPKNSEIYQTVMSGKILTGYKILKNEIDEVIGAIYTGLPDGDSFKNFLEETKKKEIGSTGFMFVMDSEGLFQLHPSLDDQRASGEIVENILKKKEGFYSGSFSSRDGSEKKMIVVTTYFKPMDWIVGASISVREFNKDLNSITIFMIVGSVLTIILFIFIFGLFSNRVLKELIQNLMGSVGTIVEQADSIKNSNDSLTSQSHDQASALQENSATVEEITATVKQTSENADKAFKSSQEATKNAKDGAQVSVQVQGAMDDIVDSSSKIRDIVTLVQEIAFQTNILAINAAIEAANAGDSGKGFAVVAIEVRDLAQRSAEAAQEIRDLISSSIDHVEKGTLLVKESSTKLEEIATGVYQVNDLMGEITAASREQAIALEEINKTINLLDSNTQKNAAMAVDVSKGGEVMRDNASNLQQMIKDHFQWK